MDVPEIVLYPPPFQVERSILQGLQLILNQVLAVCVSPLDPTPPALISQISSNC